MVVRDNLIRFQKPMNVNAEQLGLENNRPYQIWLRSIAVNVVHNNELSVLSFSSVFQSFNPSLNNFHDAVISIVWFCFQIFQILPLNSVFSQTNLFFPQGPGGSTAILQDWPGVTGGRAPRCAGRIWFQLKGQSFMMLLSL